MTSEATRTCASFKHSLNSEQLVTCSEEAADLDALKTDLRAQHQPANDTEEILVNEMAEQFWRMRRARRLEASLFDGGNFALTQLAAVQRMMTSAERGFHKALTALRQLQKDEPAGLTQAKTQEKQHGFVSQNEEVVKRVENQVENPPAGHRPALLPVAAHLGFVSQSEPNHEQNRDSEGAAAGFVPQSAASVGVAPSECPPDVDPMEWSRFWDSVNLIRSRQCQRPTSDS
jgi:hypothetical protein